VEERYARDLLAQRSEGLGYLLKDRVADGAEFVEALRRVAANGTALDPKVVRKHVASIFGKLRLPPSQEDHRRVLAVLAWINSE
jgi:DNA-binding NarL/FixJ family response regulator